MHYTCNFKVTMGNNFFIFELNNFNIILRQKLLYILFNTIWNVRKQFLFGVKLILTTKRLKRALHLVQKLLGHHFFDFYWNLNFIYKFIKGVEFICKYCIFYYGIWNHLNMCHRILSIELIIGFSSEKWFNFSWKRKCYLHMRKLEVTNLFYDIIYVWTDSANQWLPIPIQCYCTYGNFCLHITLVFLVLMEFLQRSATMK